MMGRLATFLLLALCILIAVEKGKAKGRKKDKDKLKGGCKIKTDATNIEKLCLKKGELRVTIFYR